MDVLEKIYTPQFSPKPNPAMLQQPQPPSIEYTGYPDPADVLPGWEDPYHRQFIPADVWKETVGAGAERSSPPPSQPPQSQIDVRPTYINVHVSYRILSYQIVSYHIVPYRTTHSTILYITSYRIVTRIV